jgi:hypothetical protein
MKRKKNKYTKREGEREEEKIQEWGSAHYKHCTRRSYLIVESQMRTFDAHHTDYHQYHASSLWR